MQFSGRVCSPGSVIPNDADPDCRSFLFCTQQEPVVKHCASGLRFDPSCNCCNHAIQVICEHSSTAQVPKPLPMPTTAMNLVTTKAPFTKKPRVRPSGNDIKWMNTILRYIKFYSIFQVAPAHQVQWYLIMLTQTAIPSFSALNANLLSSAAHQD